MTKKEIEKNGNRKQIAGTAEILTGTLLGDLLALIGSLGFSVYILAIDSFTARDDVIALTIL